MFRVLLTAYVTAVMLAGPSVCCCTTAHLLAGCFGDDTAGAKQAAAPCCCGRHAPRENDGVETPAAVDESDCPSAPGEQQECPCHKNKTHAVAEAWKQVADLQQVRSIIPAPLDVPSPLVTAVETNVGCGDGQIPNRASHFSSAREFLRALRTYLI